MVWSLFCGYLVPMPIIERSPFAFVAKIAEWLPFYYMFGAPIAMTHQHMTHAQVGHVIGGQVAWAMAAVALALWVWRTGVRRFEAVGA
jgi:ABC-type uncharacterized transport system permease subunit